MSKIIHNLCKMQRTLWKWWNGVEIGGNAVEMPWKWMASLNARAREIYTNKCFCEKDSDGWNYKIVIGG